MEDHEKDIIARNLPQLIEMTNCSVYLISILEANGVLNKADTDILESKILTAFEKKKKFYDIIVTRTAAFQELLDALIKTNQTGVFSLLVTGVQSTTEKFFGKSTEEDFVRASRKSKSILHNDRLPMKRRNTENYRRTISFNVYEPCKLFTGRKETIEELREKFKPGCTAIICQASIVGLGGIGKTELAKKFISLLLTEKTELESVSVIWLNAETEIRLENDFRTLAKDELEIVTKNVSNEEKDILVILKEVYEYFANQDCIFVFDNAENDAYLTRFLPSSHSFREQDAKRPLALITSRDSNWSLQSQLVINLDVWSNEEAENFVTKSLFANLEPVVEMSDENNKQISKLTVRLQRFPLALQQAVSYIRKEREVDKSYCIDNYLAELEKYTEHLLSVPLSGYQLTTYETWNATMRHIAADKNFGEVATNILHQLSYLSSDKVVCSLFSSICEDRFILRQALKLLHRYSIVKMFTRSTDNEICVSIHRLVQDVVRTNLRLQMKESDVLTCLLRVLLKNINADTVNDALSTWSHAKTYTNLIITFPEIPQKIVTHLVYTGSHYRASNLATEEIKYLDSILPDEEKLPIAVLEARIGDVFYVQGQAENALKTLSTAIVRGTKVTRATHPVILDIRRQICIVKVLTGQLEEACEIFRQTINDWKTELTDKYFTTYLDCLTDFAGVLYVNEDFKESLKYFDLAMESGREKLSEMNFKIVAIKLFKEIVRGHLNIYDGDVDEYRQLFNQAFDLPGAEPLNLMSIGHNMAFYLWYNAGRLEAALRLCSDVITKQAIYFGKEDLNFYQITTEDMYCNFLLEKKKFDEALERAQKLYEICTDKLDLLSAQRLIASALVGQGFLDEGLFIMSNVLDEIKDVPARNRFSVFCVKVEIAMAMEKKQKFKEAYGYIIDAQQDLDSILKKSNYPVHEERVKSLIKKIKLAGNF